MEERKIARIQDIVPDLGKMEPLYGNWLIETFIPEAQVMMISGPPGGGKSTLALAMAGAISSGSKFAGFKTRQAPVLYLDRENPQIIAQGRVKQQGIVTDERFYYWGNWVKVDGGRAEAPVPSDPKVLQFVQEAPVKPLIIVDSMTAFYKGDENDSVKIRAFLHQARSLADAGATVLLIHHSGKAESAQEYRGSSDIPAALDVGFVAKKVNKGQMLEEMVIKPFKTRFVVSDETNLRYEGGAFSVRHLSAADRMKSKTKGGLIHANEQTVYSESRRLSGKQQIHVE